MLGMKINFLAVRSWCQCQEQLACWANDGTVHYQYFNKQWLKRQKRSRKLLTFFIWLPPQLSGEIQAEREVYWKVQFEKSDELSDAEWARGKKWKTFLGRALDKGWAGKGKKLLDKKNMFSFADAACAKNLTLRAEHGEKIENFMFWMERQWWSSEIKQTLHLIWVQIIIFLPWNSFIWAFILKNYWAYKKLKLFSNLKSIFEEENSRYTERLLMGSAPSLDFKSERRVMNVVHQKKVCLSFCQSFSRGQTNCGSCNRLRDKNKPSKALIPG